MADRKIERSYGCCFGLQLFLADSIKIFFSHEKKKWLVAARNSSLQSMGQSCLLEEFLYPSRFVGGVAFGLPHFDRNPIYVAIHRFML